MKIIRKKGKSSWWSLLKQMREKYRLFGVDLRGFIYVKYKHNSTQSQ